MKKSLQFAAVLSVVVVAAFITQIDLSTQVRGLLPLASVPNLPASQITSGTLALARGGTNANLSGTGGASQVLQQSSAGAAVTVAQLAFTDISGSASVAQIPNLPASIITSGQLALARGGTNADLSATGGASFVLKQSSVGAAITAAQLAYSDLSGSPAAGTVTWDKLGNAAAALTLANGANATTFNQTTPVAWTWANTTPTFASLVLTQAAISGTTVTYTGTITGGGSNAYVGASATIAGFVNGGNNGTFTVTASTATTLVVTNAGGVNETHAGTAIGAAQSSPSHVLSAQYSTSPIASAADTWSVQSVLSSAVANAISTFRILHSGSTGRASVEVPHLLITNVGLAAGDASIGSSANPNYGLTLSNAGVLFTISNGVGIFNWQNSNYSLGAGQAPNAANGAGWTESFASELLPLSTSGLTTDTVANLLPANSIIYAVVARVTTTITTTTNWAVGDATTSNRFSSPNATLVSGTTSVGQNHMAGSVTTDAAGPTQAAAAKVRITCTGANPGAGVIRIIVFFRTYTAPVN